MLHHNKTLCLNHAWTQISIRLHIQIREKCAFRSHENGFFQMILNKFNHLEKSIFLCHASCHQGSLRYSWFHLSIWSVCNPWFIHTANPLCCFEKTFSRRLVWWDMTENAWSSILYYCFLTLKCLSRSFIYLVFISYYIFS